MRRAAAFLLCVVVLGVALASLRQAEPAHAVELLLNGGFETFGASAPTNWTVSGGSATATSSPSVSGQAVQVVVAPGALVSLRQSASIAPPATYSASVHAAKIGGTGTVSLTLRFLGSGFEPLDQITTTLQPGASFALLSIRGDAPPGAVYAIVVLDVTSLSGTYTAVLDSASLYEAPIDPPAPTETPATPPTAAPTATAAGPAATPTPTMAPATSSPTAGGSTPGATSTPTTAPAPATPTNPVSTSTPKPPAPTAAPTGSGPPPKQPTPPGPVLPPGSGGGGLLANGDFEVAADGKPVGWAKFGGILSVDSAAHAGAQAGVLLSDTDSTKWIYQVVNVRGGQWYAASAFMHVASGDGEVFVRVSWYLDADGTGSALAQDDSPAIASTAWTPASTGPVQAPPEAASARVRLMLRPSGTVLGVFDDASFVEVSPPAPSDTPAATGTALPSPRATASPRPGETAVPGDGSTPSAAGGSGGSTSAPAPPEFHVAPVTGPNTLRLSEVMSDPEEPGRDSAYEWIELVNAGDQPVDLAGWRLGDAKETDALPAATVPARGFVVVAGKSATFAPGVPVVRVADGEIGGGLNNEGEVLRLLAPDGSEVDAISFGNDKTIFDPAPPAPPAGKTLGVLVAGAEPAAENWRVTIAPSPGEPNVFPAPAARTPTPRSGAKDAGSSTPMAARASAPIDPGGGSSTPWVILVVSAMAGTAAATFGGQRAWQWWKKRHDGS